MNQVLAATRNGQVAAPRGALAASLANAKTRLATASIISTENGDGALLVDEAFVYWPMTGYWRSAANIATHGYGVDRLIKAVIAEAETCARADAVESYVE